MPVIYYKGDEQAEQAIGKTMNSGFMKAYAVRKDMPTQLIYLGGHRIDDAPSYTISEAKVDPEYLHINGRNILVEKTLTNDYVKSIVFNLMLPNKLISVTDRVYQSQDNFDYDIVFLPSTCEEGCDAFYWIGEDLTLGTRQITNSIIGFDENENPITSMRTMRVAGQLKSTYGLEVQNLTAHSAALYGIDVVLDRCDVGGCPYQHMVRVGIAGHAAYSLDGGETWTNITTTAITTDVTDAALTFVKYVNGNYVIAYSDVNDADGTDGGIAYSVNGSAAILSTIYDSDGVTPYASLGVQWIEPAFNRLYAGGTAGELFYSCDNGVTWVLVEVPAGLATVTLLSASFDTTNRLLYIGAEDGEAWVYNGKSFTEISSLVGAPNTSDFLTTKVTAPGHVGFGGVGVLYENFTANDLSSSYSATVVSAAGQLQGLVSDGFTYRTLVANTEEVYIRDMLNEQVFEIKVQRATNDNITFGLEGYRLKDEGGNFYVFTTDDGNVFVVSACGLCLENICA